jgi:hypothetical protein
MIALMEAEKIVAERLSMMEREMHEFGAALPKSKNNPSLHIVVTETIEYDFGWVFTYNTREYAETGDVRFSLVGNAPFIVDKNDGGLYMTGTAHRLEHYIEQYRQGQRYF